MLTLKTAVGIAVRGEDLEFLCLKRSLRGVEIAGRLRLEKTQRQHLRGGEARAHESAAFDEVAAGEVVSAHVDWKWGMGDFR